MYIVFWLLLGGLAGWIASIITADNQRMGVLANIIVGLLGAGLGGLIASLVGLAPISIFSIWGFVFAILGSVLILLFVNLIVGRRR